MADDPKPVPPDRQQTDESLRLERQNADRALRAHRTEVQQDADAVVQHARDAADDVLDVAREKADEKIEQTAPRAVITAERALEDAALRAERDLADETLDRERQETTSALARLLPLERDKTDRYLLTERKRSDADVSHRDDFLGIVSHDLRNLLTGIAMSAVLLEQRAAPTTEGAQTREAAIRIQRYSARMNRLIGDLVDVASIDAGRLSVTSTRGDVSAVIEEALDLFSALAVTKQVSLESRITERPLPADFDHDRIIQVLANLITNAIKFTAPGGTVVVANERTAEGILVSVRDTGIGIASDKLDTVFERFWQAGKNDRRGVGLGLYISRSIVEAHGGRIWAESVSGVGSTFSFTLPA